MTLCPYGSQPNPGAPLYKWATWVDAHSWLGAVFDVFSPLVVFIQPVLHETATFCATEPTQPVYPGDAVVQAAWHDRLAWEQCAQYLQDSATWWVWSQTCQCLPNPTPAIHEGYDCAHTWNANNLAGASYELGNTFHPTAACTLTKARIFIPTNIAHTYGITLWNSATHANLYGFGYNAPGSGCFDVTLPVSQPLSSGVSYVLSYGLPSSYNYYEQTTGTAPGDSSLVFSAHSYVGGMGNFPTTASGGWEAIMPIVSMAGAPTTPAGPAVPTTSIPSLPSEACTTTADLCAQISRVLVAEQLTQRRVDLLQRRTLPFAWIAGSALTGLTGAGAVTVQDCLGAIVDLTTVPASWGSSTDTPRRLYPAAGLLQGQLGSEWDDGQWVRYEHQVVLWQDPWATGLRYNFKPGVVATVTPLYPEP